MKKRFIGITIGSILVVLQLFSDYGNTLAGVTYSISLDSLPLFLYDVFYFIGGHLVGLLGLIVLLCSIKKQKDKVDDIYNIDTQREPKCITPATYLMRNNIDVNPVTTTSSKISENKHSKQKAIIVFLSFVIVLLLCALIILSSVYIKQQEELNASASLITQLELDCANLEGDLRDITSRYYKNLEKLKAAEEKLDRALDFLTFEELTKFYLGK